MPKRKPPPIGKCVHCLTDNVLRNWDHVFPKSWYPNSTPENISKWVIPTCYECNTEYGKLEEDLLVRLACCIDPQIAESSGIYQKVLRSMDSAYAKNPKDAQRRIDRRNKILNELKHGDEIPEEVTYPGLGERWGRGKDSQVALTIPANSIRKLCEKVVRGIFFIEDGKFIEPPYCIEFYALADEGSKEIKYILEQYGKEHTRGPGLLIKRAVAREDNISGLLSIQIWGSLKMFASVREVKI